MSSEVQAKLVAEYVKDGWEVEAGSKRDYGGIVIVRRAGTDINQRPVWKRIAIYGSGNRNLEPDHFREE